MFVGVPDEVELIESYIIIKTRRVWTKCIDDSF